MKNKRPKTSLQRIVMGSIVVQVPHTKSIQGNRRFYAKHCDYKGRGFFVPVPVLTERAFLEFMLN